MLRVEAAPGRVAELVRMGLVVAQRAALVSAANADEVVRTVAAAEWPVLESRCLISRRCIGLSVTRQRFVSAVN